MSEIKRYRAEILPGIRVDVVQAKDYDYAIAALRDLLHNNGSKMANDTARDLVGFRQ